MAKEPVTAFDVTAAFKALDEMEYPTPSKRTKDVVCESIKTRRRQVTQALVQDFYDVNNSTEMDNAAKVRADDIAAAKLARIERIVDLDAESAEDLLTSYVGKRVIQCPQCMTLFYKKPEDVTVSETDENTVNVGEVCQHCGNEDGYTMIGKVDAVDEEQTTPAETTEQEVAVEEEIPAEEGGEEATDEATEEGTEETTDELPDGEEAMPAVEETTEEQQTVEESFKHNGSILTEQVLTQDEATGEATGEAPAASDEAKTGAQELTKVAADYDEFVKKLHSDPKAAAFIEYIKKISPKGERTASGIKTSAGSIDVVRGAKENDSIQAGGLLPTQNVIFMGKSFGAGWGEKWGPLSVGNGGMSCLADFCFKNPSVGNDGMPVIIYNDGSKNYLIDGHHRWSKVVAVNPTGTMKALVFGPVPGFTWTDCLEAVQMAIEAAGGYKKNESLTEATLTEAAVDENANLIELKKTGGAITNAILSDQSRWLTDVNNTKFLIEKWGKAAELNIPEDATEVPAEVRKACAEQIEANIVAGIGNPPGTAPSRTNMPQVDAASNPAAAVDQLKKGVIDITPKNEALMEASQSPEDIRARLDAFADSISQDYEDVPVSDVVLTEGEDEEFAAMLKGPVFAAFEQGMKVPKAFQEGVKKLAKAKKLTESVALDEAQGFELPTPAYVDQFASKLADAGDSLMSEAVDAQQVATEEEPQEVTLDQAQEVSEQTFQECATKALTEVYENVKSFKMTNCSLDEDFIVEGVITFKSGSTRETKYVFDECIIKENGTYELHGANKTFCEGKNFVLTASMKDKKLFTESIGYKYHVNGTLVEGLAKSK